MSMSDGLPVLLLVHGFPLDARMWQGQVDGLGDIRRVLAPDLDGHGAARGRPPSSSVADMARQLARHLDEEGVEAVDLGGLSMGGYVCFAFYRLFPHMVRSLALIDTRAAADSDAGREGRDQMAAEIRDRGSLVAADAMLPKMFTEDAPEAVRLEAQGWMLESPPEALISDLMAMRDRPNSTELLPSIDVPTVVIVGDKDPVTPPAEAEAMAAAIPGARLERIANAAHLAPVERPGDVNRALRAHLGS